MGIKELWKVTAPACEIRPLREFAVTEGFRRSTEQGLRPVGTIMRIGVDASTWMHEACAVFQYNHAGAGPSPELRTLFYRLVGLHKVACHGHFVFDGRDRPAMKRQRQVKPAPHFLTRGFQELVTAFGFTWHTAPGEAEAELATMSQLNRIDAVFTSDSDALVFGARCVIRSINLKPATTSVEVCTEDALLHGVGLSQSELVFFALCCGGDYNPAGLSGCGSEIAFRLTRYPLGKSLVHAARYESATGLHKFLAGWRNDLRNTLAYDPSGYLGRKYPALAEAIPNDFPDINVLVQYLEPLTSWSSDNWKEHRPIGVVQSSQADFVRLAAICKARFEWSATVIQSKFCSDLWEGACLRALCQLPQCSHGSYDLTFKVTDYTPASQGSVMATYRACLTGSPLIAAAQFGIDDAETIGRNNSMDPTSKTFTYITLPAVILEHLSPTSSHAFNHGHCSSPPVIPLPGMSLPSSVGFQEPSSAASGSRHMAVTRTEDDVIDLTRPTATAVMNALRGRSFPQSEYEVIDLTVDGA